MLKKLRISSVLVLCLALLTLAACAPGVNSLQKKLQNKDYTVELVTTDDLINGEFLRALDATARLTAYKDDEDLEVFWYTDKQTAKKAYEEELKKHDELEDEEKENHKVVRKGKMVAVGTVAAVKLV